MTAQMQPGQRLKLCFFPSPYVTAEQAAEEVPFSVIPSEARNPSSIETQEKRDSSARNMPRNDDILSYSAACEAVTHKHFRVAAQTLEGV